MRWVQWFWPGKPPLAHVCWVVATSESTALAHDFLTALAKRSERPLALLLLDKGPYDGPWPWAFLPPLSPARVLLRLQPDCLLIFDDDARSRALAAAAQCPVWWINGQSADLLAMGRVTVASAAQASAIGGGIVTGDPFVEWPIVPPAVRDGAFCDRFQGVRAAGRWVVYFAATSSGEETLAYSAFLNMSTQSGGLLALAPTDSARYEEVYRESIKYHLLTIRQRRLLTSEVPPKTRVYYIEEPSARQAMYACADLVVVGGTFVDGPVAMYEALSAGVPIAVGPRRTDLLVAAAVRARVVIPCTGGEDLAAQGAGVLSDPAARERWARAARDWFTLQPGARARVVALLTDDFS